MKHDLEIDLMRLLHDELPAEQARALHDRLAREPELAASYQRLAANWQRLIPPPASPAPLGYTARVMSGVRELAAAGSPAAPISWSATPRWVRAVGATALLAGALLGVSLGRGVATDNSAAGSVSGLSESYWAMVEEPSSAPVLPSPARGEAPR